MLWMFIHFPNLALEAQFMGDQRPIPQLLLQPGSQIILQCNLHALAQGVKVGMNKKTAFCLLESCALEEYNPHAEHECLKQLALMCYHQAAQIRLMKPDGLLLEMTSMLELFGGLHPYWQRLRQRLLHCGHDFVMSTGHTPRAARILAMTGTELCSDDEDEIMQTLLQLSIDELDLPERPVKKLHGMGIHKYGQLNNLPLKELGFRFGKEFVKRLQQLQRDNLPPSSFQLPESFQQTVHLSYEAEHARGLVFPLRRVLLNLEAYLLTRQKLCEKILIKMEHRDGTASLLTVPSVNGSYLQQDWLALLQIQLENLKLKNPVVSLTLRGKGFVPMIGENEDLIGGRHLQADSNRLHSILLGRLGEGNVRTLRAEPDPRPEIASQLRNSHDNNTDSFPKPWPAFIFAVPRPVDINSYSILEGPDRMEGGWWDGPPIKRDYYIARKRRAVHWLFQRDDGIWFLHGVFS